MATFALAVTLLQVIATGGGGGSLALGGKLVLAASLAPGKEDESDVPQYSPVWFLPAAVTGITLTIVQIRRPDPPSWAVTRGPGRHGHTAGGDSGPRATSGANLVARRAVEELSAPLKSSGSGVYGGSIAVLDSGRWFVDVSFADTSTRTTETWLPIEAGSSEVLHETRPFYRPPRPAEGRPGQADTVALYGLSGVILIAVAHSGRGRAPLLQARARRSLTAGRSRSGCRNAGPARRRGGGQRVRSLGDRPR
ncbi:hypothetical protein ACFV1X_26380 [Streptomyces coelicoflavus]|uniref:hypothetical protein n=1 Tax=Streptomyces coelicoflavus TaxID=285562 RepID=UPI0036A66B81